jgi:hypothetical protein
MVENSMIKTIMLFISFTIVCLAHADGIPSAPPMITNTSVTLPPSIKSLNQNPDQANTVVTPKPKPILTDEQRKARHKFLVIYRSAQPDVKTKMKDRVKTDNDLRSRLGLKPIQK